VKYVASALQSSLGNTPASRLNRHQMAEHTTRKPVAAGFEAQYAIAGVLGEAPKALISLKLRVLGD